VIFPFSAGFIEQNSSPPLLNVILCEVPVKNYTYAHQKATGMLNTRLLVMITLENEKLLGSGYFRYRPG